MKYYLKVPGTLGRGQFPWRKGKKSIAYEDLYFLMERGMKCPERHWRMMVNLKDEQKYYFVQIK